MRSSTTTSDSGTAYKYITYCLVATDSVTKSDAIPRDSIVVISPQGLPLHYTLFHVEQTNLTTNR